MDKEILIAKVAELIKEAGFLGSFGKLLSAKQMRTGMHQLGRYSKSLTKGVEKGRTMPTYRESQLVLGGTRNLVRGGLKTGGTYLGLGALGVGGGLAAKKMLSNKEE